MKIASLLFLPIIFILLGCGDNSSTVGPENDIETLYQRFHGKYKVVSSTSNEPLDVDFDGVASRDLLKEIAALNDYGAFLELRVKYPDHSAFLFNQFWPEQYVHSYTGSNFDWNGLDALEYNPAYSVMYAQQAIPYSFTFTDDLSQVLIIPNEIPEKARWIKPEAVFVQGQNRLRLTNRRRIYTRTGVKEVIITTVYERFTMTT